MVGPKALAYSIRAAINEGMPRHRLAGGHRVPTPKTEGCVPKWKYADSLDQGHGPPTKH
jgi:hypothetical protein